MGASAPGSRERQAAEAPPVRVSQSRCREFGPARPQKQMRRRKKRRRCIQTRPNHRGQRRPVRPPRVWLRSPHRSKTSAAWTHFNPRCPHGQRPLRSILRGASAIVSIHAALTGSDSRTSLPMRRCWSFNPRCPCGQRPSTGSPKRCCTMFQSTLPLRAATTLTVFPASMKPFQSTLPLRAATRGDQRERQASGVSIHAALTGSDVTIDVYKRQRTLGVHR